MKLEDLKTGDIIVLEDKTAFYFSNDGLKDFMNDYYDAKSDYLFVDMQGECCFFPFEEIQDSIEEIRRDDKIIYKPKPKFEREKHIKLLKEWYENPDKYINELEGFKTLQQQVKALGLNSNAITSYACMYDVLAGEGDCKNCPLPYCVTPNSTYSLFNMIRYVEDLDAKKEFIKTLINTTPKE